MKTKLTLFVIFFSINFFAVAQLFQEHFQIAGRHFHEVTVDQLGSSSDDLVIAGNFFELSFDNPLMEVVRIDELSGNLLWHYMFYDPSIIHEDVRVFDMCTYSGAAGDVIALTGSLMIADTSYMFIARIDEFGNYIDGAYYQDLVASANHSQGLNIIHTQTGFVVGGFSNMDYSHSTGDSTTGFVMKSDFNLIPVWTKNIHTYHPNSSFDYDMVADVTETDDGYFVTGSVTSLPFSTQQAVLCLKLDFSGNVVWTNSYLYGNSRDVGVDAYYDASTDEIYLLANYSASHYFGVTVLDDNSGAIDVSRSFRAYDWNNLNRYGFKIMESDDTANLVVAGYVRDGTYIDQNSNTVFAQSLPFMYEFKKSSGDQVGDNYFYNVPYIDPGFSDYFDFWSAQMPLIYYPEMALNLNNSDEYFLAGFRTDSVFGFTETEFIKTDNMLMNECFRTPLNLLHDPMQPNTVVTGTSDATPMQFAFSLTPVPFDHLIDTSCRVMPPPPGGCRCDSLAKDVNDGFDYSVSALQLNLKPLSLSVNCDSVRWDFGDGTTATSQGNNPVIHNYTSGDTYLVCMYVTRYADDGTICEDSICYDDVFVPGGLGLEEKDDHGIKIYPNPANEQINISIEQQDKAVTYEMYSTMGVRVLDGRLESPVSTIELGSLTSGIYFIRINIGSDVLIRKVFVE